MADASTARKLDEALPAHVTRRAGFGGGKGPPPFRPSIAFSSNAWLAVLMFLGAEAMFFAGLIGAFIVFRIANPVWPPPFQPRLPIAVTGINTLVLLASAITIRLALRAIQRGDRKRLIRFLSLTAAGGVIFLLVQGFEWMRLLHFGLTLSSSIYGGLFYTIIGCHAVHVFGALVWLLVVWYNAAAGKYTPQNHIGLQTCSMYWVFVVALWPLLYGLVYLY